MRSSPPNNSGVSVNAMTAPCCISPMIRVGYDLPDGGQVGMNCAKTPFKMEKLASSQLRVESIYVTMSGAKNDIVPFTSWFDFALKSAFINSTSSSDAPVVSAISGYGSGDPCSLSSAADVLILKTKLPAATAPIPAHFRKLRREAKSLSRKVEQNLHMLMSPQCSCEANKLIL